MAALLPELRGKLEKAILAARDAAEKAAKASLERLAVERQDLLAGLSPDDRKLRVALRERARQLGDGSQSKGMGLLVEEVAYEQWHRMLFARFLAENHLLMHPQGVAVTLQDCAELAREEGEPDAWQLAARYASRMLPGIFRQNDPSAQVRFAPEGTQALEGVLAGIPAAVFTADDGLGWVYQFWQTKRKKAVSSSGRKIERLDLAAYSQLFTEHYMVQFLLENSLGAWWAARHPKSPLVREFTYLRFREDGTPAAGTFPGWPDRAADVTVMDPCCGSGHFLVAAFEMLRRMRSEEEESSDADAAEAVLRDNIFGLELDPRCIQIAAFALALAAWKVDRYRPLPSLRLACSGIPVGGQLEKWTELAPDDAELQRVLEQLYGLFRHAPELGSLINPADAPVRDRMFTPDFSKVAPLLERAMSRGRAVSDPVAAVFGESARSTAEAATLLSRKFHLVSTNVPYLGRSKQSDSLKQFADSFYPVSKRDLATMFLERIQDFTVPGGSYAVVTAATWLFLGRYTDFRNKILDRQTWLIAAVLGPGAFETISGEVVNTALLILMNQHPQTEHIMSGVLASTRLTPFEKAASLRTEPLLEIEQAVQRQNPDSRISLDAVGSTTLLGRYANAWQGIKTSDDPRFVRCFWELPWPSPGWRFFQRNATATEPYGGLEHVLFWEDGHGVLTTVCQKGASFRGAAAWGKPGVAVSQMRRLPATLYTGELFDSSVSPVVPFDSDHLSAIWACCQSEDYKDAVRKLDSKPIITNSTLVKVPFDLPRWQRVAETLGPLPEPSSSSPTQWLFEGSPSGSTHPLQVAVARLLGYHWPKQQPDGMGALTAKDGIVLLAPIAGQQPAVERLRALLACAYGDSWTPALESRLLADVGFANKSLESWLTDGFFEQHCTTFHQRPFIWHIWDGRKDGFSALVNYHMFDAELLGKLIYTYLGRDWIPTQKAAAEGKTPGAEGRLISALELQKKLIAIREGEDPFDIYVRWKPLHAQPIGWEPDLNDGVRFNIRPFVKAGLLRSRVNVNWNQDRGSNPDGSERINDIHLTLAEKRAARGATATA